MTGADGVRAEENQKEKERKNRLLFCGFIQASSPRRWRGMAPPPFAGDGGGIRRRRRRSHAN